MIPKELTPGEEARRDPSAAGLGAPISQLVALMPAAVYTCDADGRITFYNRQVAEMWGREPRLGDDQEKYCGSFRMWTPNGELLKHAQCPMADAVREARSARNLEVVIEQPSGKRVIANVNIDPLYDNNHQVIGAINVLVDVTERKRAEAAARASDMKYRGLFDSIDTGYCVIEVIFDVADQPVDYVFLEYNPAFEKQTGLVHPIGKRVGSLMPAPEKYWFETYGRIVRTGQPERFEHRDG